MKKELLFLILMFSQLCLSQVSLEKNKLIKGEEKFKMSQYEQVFTNPQALSYAKKSRNNNTIATIFGVVGGAAVGVGLGDVLFNNKSQRQQVMGYTFETKPDHSVAWLVAGIGAGLIGIGIPFAISSSKNMKKAILTENEGTVAFQPYFKIAPKGNGVAMSYNF